MKDCADIWLSCGDAIMGDTVEYAKGSQIYLKIEKLPHNAKIKFTAIKVLSLKKYMMLQRIPLMKRISGGRG